ncbi:MAG TPA: SRPBCC domain-containing protein [Azospirillaceae bacterium]|nr:SRPBCC domain-containing protein [Azospirillaceae bacterium]HRQ80581.1 SRPBCC domain-containing protein [Azospirillaceae bacterium]
MSESELVTSVCIQAPPSRVWSVLTDFPAYAAWNPFLTSVQGDLRLGARLTIRLAPPGKPAVSVRPTITALEPCKRLVWQGFALAPGFFDGEHGFELEPLGQTACRLTHAERFSGVLVAVVGPLLLDSTRLGFVNMNNALKLRAESDIPPLV